MGLPAKPIDLEVREAFKAATKRGCKGWINASGYRSINLKIHGKWTSYLVHRLVFACHYEMDPGEFEVDHINRIRDDNRIENLRLADECQNCHNAKLRKDSTTGVKGVSRHKISEGKYCWRAVVRANGRYYRKHFPLTLEGFGKAVDCANQMREEHHKNYGSKGI